MVIKLEKITDRVCVKIDDEVTCTLRPHTIVLTDTDRGRLLDGREVSKIGDKWYYVARKVFTEDVLRSHWGSGEPIVHKGKEYRVGRMSYGDYFFEPAGYRGGEREPFHPETLWLRKIEKEPYFYEIEERPTSSALKFW